MNKKKIIILSTTALSLIAIIGITVVTISKNNKNLEVFKSNVTTFSELQNTYVIDDAREYTDLLSTSEKILANKKAKEIDSTKDKMTELEKKIKDANVSSLDTTIEKIKKIDISKLKNKANLEKQLKEIIALKSNGNFKEAIQKATKLETTIAKEKADFDIAEKKRLAKAKAEQEIKTQNQKKLDVILNAINYIFDSKHKNIIPIELLWTVPFQYMPKDDSGIPVCPHSIKKISNFSTNDFLVSAEPYREPTAAIPDGLPINTFSLIVSPSFEKDMLSLGVIEYSSYTVGGNSSYRYELYKNGDVIMHYKGDPPVKIK